MGLGLGLGLGLGSGFGDARRVPGARADELPAAAAAVGGGRMDAASEAIRACFDLGGTCSGLGLGLGLGLGQGLGLG